MDDEKLILLVQERSEIYNKYNPRFKILEKKHEAWVQIANEMGTTVQDCMRRWTCIRDRFTRECKRMSEAPDEPRYVWPYFEMMDFIRPFVTNRPIRGLTRNDRKVPFETIRSPLPSIVKKDLTNSPNYPILTKNSTPPSPTPSISASATMSPVQCTEFTQIFDDPLIETPLPSIKPALNTSVDVDKSFCDAVETLKKACALNDARHANPAVYAFGEMIVSTICRMTSRNQLKAMQQVTDIVMRIKLEEDEPIEQLSYCIE